MARIFFVTDYERGNYVNCPRVKRDVKIILDCWNCRHFKGGGITEDGRFYVNCMFTNVDHNVQMELKGEWK